MPEIKQEFLQNEPGRETSRTGQREQAASENEALIEEIKELRNLLAEKMEIIEKQRKVIESLARQTTEDYLTEVYNRRGFMEEAEKFLNTLEGNLAAKKERREEGGIKNLAFLYIDFDNFSLINNRFSHQMGDEVLARCAKLFKEQTRDLDIVGRIGGDEFIVCLVDVESEEEAQAVADKLKSAVESLGVEVGGQSRKLSELFEETKIGISIGVSLARQKGDKKVASLQELMGRADAFMYKDKETRKGREKAE